MKAVKLLLSVSMMLFVLASYGFAVEDQDAKININTATVEELATLPGVGDSTAKNIVDHREKMGSFQTIDDLKNVKGIGDKKFEKIKEMITVGKADTTASN